MLRNDGDVRGIPVSNRKTCYPWRDGACRFGNSRRNAHFRNAGAHDNAPLQVTSQPARPSEPADAWQSKWPPLSSQGGNSQASPSKWPAPSQPTGNTAPQGVTTGSTAPDRDDWATIVARVQSFVLPQEHSGTKNEQTVGMRDGNNLVATRYAALPPP